MEIKKLTKSFGANTVLRGIDLTVNKGDVIAILGPSGSGKTTLLRCINFLEKSDSGTMVFGGQSYDLGHMRKADIAAIRKKTAFVFQNYNLFANLTALGNVTLGLTSARKMDKEKARRIGMEMLARVGLADRADYYPIQLSGGQQQRVAIARALATEPEIIYSERVEPRHLHGKRQYCGARALWGAFCQSPRAADERLPEKHPHATRCLISSRRQELWGHIKGFALSAARALGSH